MKRQIDMGLVEFREDHTQPPLRKAHLRPVPEELDEDEANGEIDFDEEENNIGMQVMQSVIYKQSQVAVKYLRQLMGSKAFPNPKDHEVIARLIRYLTAPDENAVVLDSFAGSGTTGEAVLAANGEDNGNRRFVLVEQEDYADTLTAERLRRVIRGVPTARDENVQAGRGGSFTFLRLGQSFDEESLLQGSLPSYADMARYVFFTATGEKLDNASLNEDAFYVGESRNYSVYLIYRPDVEFLKNTPLNLSFVAQLPANPKKMRLIIGSHKYLDEERMREHRVEFCQLPWSIYKFRAK